MPDLSGTVDVAQAVLWGIIGVCVLAGVVYEWLTGKSGPSK